MTLTMKANELQSIANSLIPAWENEKNNVKMQVIPMYNLIKLKKFIQDEAIKLTETVTTLAEQAGGERLPNGGIKIPDEKIKEVDEALATLSDEDIEIEYTPIKITSDDTVPMSILEPLFPFIEIQE